MPRCNHCGKTNRDGSLFCQDCGHKLDPGSGAAAVSGVGCSACGTVNPEGMNFCKMCGSSLAQKAAPAPVDGNPTVKAQAAPAAAPSGKANCPACGKQTPTGFAFCQHCGQRLTAAGQATTTAQGPTAAAPARPDHRSEARPAVAPNLTPPAGMPRPSASQPAVRPADEAFAKTIMPTGLT